MMTTHYMDEAELLCDRVAVMDYDKIVAIRYAKEALIKQLLGRGFSKDHNVETSRSKRHLY